MLQKSRRIECRKILDAARNQRCTVNSPWCNYDETTTVACHYGEPGEKGERYKPDDTSVVFGCSGCHDFLDGRVQPVAGNVDQELAYAEREWYWFRAMRRTWRILVEDKVLK